jgi:hypothetical protein
MAVSILKDLRFSVLSSVCVSQAKLSSGQVTSDSTSRWLSQCVSPVPFRVLGWLRHSPAAFILGLRLAGLPLCWTVPWIGKELLTLLAKVSHMATPEFNRMGIEGPLMGGETRMSVRGNVTAWASVPYFAMCN